MANNATFLMSGPITNLFNVDTDIATVNRIPGLLAVWDIIRYVSDKYFDVVRRTLLLLGVPVKDVRVASSEVVHAYAKALAEH